MNALRALTAALALLLSAACSQTITPDGPSGEPLLRGPVESITHRATASGLLVRAGPGSNEPCGIQATATAETRVFVRLASGALRLADLSSIAVGDTVEVYVTGPVAQSCPVQGTVADLVKVGG